MAAARRGDPRHRRRHLGSARGRRSTYRRDIRLASRSGAPYPIRCRPEPGWAEQDARLWRSAALAALARLIRRLRARGSPARGTRVLAIGLTGQCPSVVPVDRRGEPIWPGLMYRDNRATAEAAEIRERFGDRGDPRRSPATCRRRSTSLPKLDVAAPRTGRRCSTRTRSSSSRGIVAALALTGEAATDGTHAAATLLYDLRPGRLVRRRCSPRSSWTPASRPSFRRRPSLGRAPPGPRPAVRPAGAGPRDPRRRRLAGLRPRRRRGGAGTGQRDGRLVDLPQLGRAEPPRRAAHHPLPARDPGTVHDRDGHQHDRRGGRLGGRPPLRRDAPARRRPRTTPPLDAEAGGRRPPAPTGCSLCRSWATASATTRTCAAAFTGLSAAPRPGRPGPGRSSKASPSRSGPARPAARGRRAGHRAADLGRRRAAGDVEPDQGRRHRAPGADESRRRARPPASRCWPASASGVYRDVADADRAVRPARSGRSSRIRRPTARCTTSSTRPTGRLTRRRPRRSASLEDGALKMRLRSGSTPASRSSAGRARRTGRRSSGTTSASTSSSSRST